MLSGSATQRHRGSRAAALLIALALAAGIFGCGGGDTTSSESAGTGAQGSSPGEVADGGSPSGGQESAARAGEGKAGSHQSDGGAVGREAGKNGGKRTAEPSRGGQAKPPHQVTAIEKQAAEHCPRDLDLDQCKALVKVAKQTQDPPSYPVSEPEDCLQVMSKSECEAIYEAQKQAVQAAGTSVDVQACLRNPTPECEAIVRPILERQRAAEEASK